MNNYSDNDANGDTGNYAFSAAQTGLPATNGVGLGGGSVGFGYASFLLGAVSSATIQPPFQPTYTKQAWAAFIQDDWKVNRKLTLNYGLRWDLLGSARAGA
jgi:outer membrane receptor protein involved in Fe transport